MFGTIKRFFNLDKPVAQFVRKGNDVHYISEKHLDVIENYLKDKSIPLPSFLHGLEDKHLQTILNIGRNTTGDSKVFHVHNVEFDDAGKIKSFKSTFHELDNLPKSESNLAEKVKPHLDKEHSVLRSPGAYTVGGITALGIGLKALKTLNSKDE